MNLPGRWPCDCQVPQPGFLMHWCACIGGVPPRTIRNSMSFPFVELDVILPGFNVRNLLVTTQCFSSLSLRKVVGKMSSTFWHTGYAIPHGNFLGNPQEIAGLIKGLLTIGFPEPLRVALDSHESLSLGATSRDLDLDPGFVRTSPIHLIWV